MVLRYLLFHHALQGMLVLAAKSSPASFGLGDLIGEHAALSHSVMMDVEHDLGRGLGVSSGRIFSST